MDDKFIAIGIDFGTTYSGVAFASSANPDAIEVITTWDAAHGQEKVPSKISYHNRSSDVDWGHGIPADADPLSWFKLLLVNEKNLTPDVRDSSYIAAARKRLAASGKTPIETVAKYLRQLWRHTLDELTKRFGDLVVRYTQFKVYLTVPAIWDEPARKLMRLAALKAGICDSREDAKATYLELVSEPEAAALAVFQEYKGQHSAQVGDVFIVCDAGGGTVDLVSYEVLSINPMEVKEFVRGDGGMCGAIFIDEQFEEQAEKSLGKRWALMDPASRKRIFDSQWENGIKRNFDDKNQEYTVALPGDFFSRRDVLLGRRDSKKGEIPLKKGQMVIQSSHIRQWFERSIQPTTHLIRNQQIEAEKKKKKPKSILLVGGFGSCKYLYARLSDHFGPKGIRVLQPSGSRGWSAISRGAVIRGLSDTGTKFANQSAVRSRISRVNYGMSSRPIFDPLKHELIDRCWDKEEGVWRAKRQMRWYLHMGEDVYDKKPVTFLYHVLLRYPQDTYVLDTYRNRDDHPPSRRTDQVHEFVTIKIPLKALWSRLPTQLSAKDKAELRRLDFEVRLVTTGTSLQWSVIVDGVPQAEKEVEIEEEGDLLPKSYT